jgi:hypothetical protein
VQAGPTAVRVGDIFIGVRANDEEMHALLLDALRPLVVDDVDAPPNLSLRFGQPDGQVRDLHLLYRSGLSVVRTTSPGRLLRAAIRHLEGFAPPPPDAMPVKAKLLVRGDDAALVDSRFGGTVDILERRLQRLGYSLVDVYTPLLDRATLEVRLESPRLGIAGDARAAIDRLYPPAPHEVELHDRRYRLRGLVVWGEPEGDGESPARRYAELTPLAADLDQEVDARDLDVLRRLPQACGITRIAYPDARTLFATLRDISS